MQSVATMLAFVFLFVLGNLNVIQYADSAAPIMPVPQTPPATSPTQNPGTGFPNQAGAQAPGNLWEASSKLATVLGDTFQRIIQHKKNTLSSAIISLGKAFNETTNQIGSGLKPDQTQTGIQATPASPIPQPSQPTGTPPNPSPATQTPGQNPVPAQPAPVTQP